LPLVSSFRLSFYFNFWNEGICAQVSAVCTVINTFIVSTNLGPNLLIVSWAISTKTSFYSTTFLISSMLFFILV
jgi:hypothetical protein